MRFQQILKASDLQKQPKVFSKSSMRRLRDLLTENKREARVALEAATAIHAQVAAAGHKRPARAHEKAAVQVQSVHSATSSHDQAMLHVRPLLQGFANRSSTATRGLSC